MVRSLLFIVMLSVSLPGWTGMPSARALQVGPDNATDVAPRADAADVQSRFEAIEEKLDQLEAYVTLDQRRQLLDEVDVMLKDFKADYPRNDYSSYLRGRMLAVLGRPREAATNLQDFVETRRGRTDWEAHLRIGDLLVDEYPRLAQSYYARADELRPLEPRVRFGLARSNARYGKREDAIRIVRELIASDASDNPDFRKFLASTLLAEQSWEEAEQAAVDALRALRRELDEHPEAVESLVDISDMLTVRIQSRRAIMALSEPTPDDSMTVAQLLVERIENREIISLLEPLRLLEEAIQERVSNGRAIPASMRLALAELQIRVNRKEQAKAELKTILETQPDHEGATLLLAGLTADTSGASDGNENNPEGAGTPPQE